MMVSSIESRKHELIYTIRRENQMGRKLMHTLIKETKKREMTQKHYCKETAKQ